MRTIRYSDSTAGAAASAEPADPWREKVVKLIPAEVVTAYMGVQGIIAASTENGASPLAPWLLFALFVIGLVCTPLYLRKITLADAQPPAPRQYWLTTIAFVIWALATSQPLSALGIELPPPVTAVLLPIFTFIAGAL